MCVRDCKKEKMISRETERHEHNDVKKDWCTLCDTFIYKSKCNLFY